MAKEITTKSSFGTVAVNHLSPARQEGWPTAINIVLSFEQALKLQLGLQPALLELNKLNRSTTAGRRAAINLCLFTNPVRFGDHADRKFGIWIAPLAA